MTDEESSEKGIYFDGVKYKDGEAYDWRSYVGSAGGFFGILQRWMDYLLNNKKMYDTLEQHASLDDISTFDASRITDMNQNRGVSH